MKFFQNSIITFLVIINCFNGLAQNREIKFDHGKWAEILERSKNENKQIYLDCYTDWCGPCKWMAKNVFTNDTVADFYNSHFINAKIDMEKGEGIELAKKYGIQAYPTMLYLNSAGDIIHRTCGSALAATFIEWGKNSLDPEKQLSAFTKKFNDGNTDSETALTYFMMLESAYQPFNSELAKYLSTQKETDLTSKNNWIIIYKYLDDYSSREFNFLEKNQETFSKIYSKDSVRNKINSVYTSGLNTAITKKDNELTLKLKTKIKASGNPDSEKIILDADLKIYQRDEDWVNYSITAKQYAEKYAMDNAFALNGIAWNFYENIADKKMLEEAAKWAKRSTDIENAYANNDTYAAILCKLERKAEAKTIAEKAIELAKKTGDDYSSTEALLKKIDKLK